MLHLNKGKDERALPKGNKKSLDNCRTPVNQGKYEPGGIHIHFQFSLDENIKKQQKLSIECI